MPDSETPDSETPGSETPGNAHAPDQSGSGKPTETRASGPVPDSSAPFEDNRQRLDGDTAGGMLGAIFPFDMARAVATCAGCGTRYPLGAMMAYMHGMGTILRCPTCDTALIRVAHILDRYFLDLRGVRVLQIAEAASG